MKMRNILALSMAAVTALTSTSIAAFAEGADSEALAAAITTAKTRLDIPEELTEFSYSVNNSYLQDSYVLTWSAPDSGSGEYQYYSATVRGNLITNVHSSNDGWGKSNRNTLAKLTGDQLYAKAKTAVRRLDPTIASVIEMDRDSLSINMYSDIAAFSFRRVKDGVPVNNDGGSVRLDKNTGELISFSLTWHDKAAFQSADKAISADEAKQKYIDMVNVEPQYEIEYDWNTKQTTARLVYVQKDSGVINAFTGNKSDFDADGFYDDSSNEEEDAAAGMDNGKGGGGYQFTEQEKAELDKKLPYGNSEAVIKLLKSDKYLSYNDNMELSDSQLYKVKFASGDKYYYRAAFTTDDWGTESEYPETIEVDDGFIYEDTGKPWQAVDITVDAESGQIISYSYFDSEAAEKTSYDIDKADKLAEKIAKKYAGDAFGEQRKNSSNTYEYTDDQKITRYSGSSHTWDRYVNDIVVVGDGITVEFNADMKLTTYQFNYTDVEFPDASKMLPVGDIVDKFWQNNDIDLYYLARFSKKKTKTVLVYGVDGYLYADAFTGESLYDSWTREKNDLSGIADTELRAQAQALSDHGFYISSEKFSENDPASAKVFGDMIRARIDENENTDSLTRGQALVIFVRGMVGDTVPSLKGIFKSPFSDVEDTDHNVGYYAVAYAMGVVGGDKLEPDSAFTMGDMIRTVYTYYSTVYTYYSAEK